MKPSRRSQPYRKGAPTRAGGALSAMLRGRAMVGTKPAGPRRAGGKLAAALAKRTR